jgi:hypothetical protein
MLGGLGRATCQCWGLVGGSPKAKVKNQGVFGKESMHKERDSWKETQHMHMQGKQQLEGITTHMHARKT